MKKGTLYIFILTIFIAQSIFGVSAFSGKQVTAVSGLSFLNNVVLLEEATSREQLANTRADVIIVHINSEGMINLGNETISFEPELFGEGIPCLYIDSAECVDPAIDLLSEKIPYSYICSKDATLVSLVRKNCPLACGMIDFRNSDASEIQIRNTVNENYAKCALISSNQLTQTEALTLRKLMITLYVEAADDTERYTALAYGADGLLGNAAEAKYSLTLPEVPVYAPRPFLVAHRGNSAAMRDDGLSLYTENTVQAAQATYSEFHPDFIEIDLQLSSDKRVVIMHDSTLDRTTNGTGNIADMTLSQIRRYKVDGGNSSGEYLDEIPVLEDFFETFRNTDLFFILELKTGDPACVDAAVEIIKDYDISGKVNFISFSKSQLEYARQICPEISISLLTGSEYDGNSDDFAEQIIKTINPINASLSADYNTLDAENVGELAKYGIKANAWTVNTPAEFYNNGFASVTTDICQAAEDTPYTIQPDQLVYEISVGQKIRFGAQITARNPAFNTHADCKVIALTNGFPLREVEDGYIADSEGEGVFSLLYESTYFGVISVPVTVKATRQGGCSGNINASLLVFPCLIVVSTLMIRSKRKN